MIRAIVGPTATGKSAIAIGIAKSLGAEIICADSMTIYRGMDIGTAKPTPEDRARVPHHLLDVADPGEVFTVARYQELANEVLERIDVPLLVGGSGLYYQAVVDQLTFPPTDAAVRARIDTEPLDALTDRLRASDPVAAETINLKNKRRVARALEVIELTGKPFSSFRDDWGRRDDPGWHEEHPVRVAGIDLDSKALRARIVRRAHEMLRAGLLEEVRGLVHAGFRDALTASQAVGYAQAIELLDARINVERFVEKVTKATMRLARRQRAWFRRDPRVRWFDAEDPDTAPRMLEYLAG